ncbi:hypothetical protein GOV14_04525 [Candidatus Pacearchaeota archaeon]|nr:hypothetical protein [Candidatus Pacearchaeota archaeon]
MPHQCTKCGVIYKDASPEILKGCSCGSKFFYYIKQEALDKKKETVDEQLFDALPQDIQDKITELDKADKDQIERDIREITGLNDEEMEKPVILDLESVKVISPGKFEIDVVNLFNKKRPLIYKLEEGKYIIDLAASFKASTDELSRKIKDPDA